MKAIKEYIENVKKFIDYAFIDKKHISKFELLIKLKEIEKVLIEFPEKENKTIKEYENSVNAIIKEFEKKQDINFEFWIGTFGENATFGDVLIFNFSDIYHDLKTNQPKDNIINWCYLQLDNAEKGLQTFNYKSYCMGLRNKDL